MKMAGAEREEFLQFLAEQYLFEQEFADVQNIKRLKTLN